MGQCLRGQLALGVRPQHPQEGTKLGRDLDHFRKEGAKLVTGAYRLVAYEDRGVSVVARQAARELKPDRYGLVLADNSKC